MSEEHKNYLGQLTAPRAIRFERIFSAPAEEVWQYITSETLLPTWIAKASVDLRVGGRIKLHFSDDGDPEGHCKGDGVKDDQDDQGGRITVCEPNQRLTYLVLDPNGGETTLSYTLIPLNGQTLLVLEHSDLPPELMVAFAAGWHGYLDALGCRLRGEEPQPLTPLFEAMMKRYTFVLATASVVLTSQAAYANADGTYQAEVAERNRLVTKYDRLCRDEDDLNRAISEMRRVSSVDSEKSLDYLMQDLKNKESDIHKLELDIRDLDQAILVTPK